MTPVQRRAWAVGWLAAAAFVGFVISLRWLESRYQLLITDEQLRFERPWAALLLLAAPMAWIGRVWVQGLSRPRLQFSRAAALRNPKGSWRGRLTSLPNALRTVALALLVVGLAGPQSIHARDTAEVSGIEIILTLDMSRYDSQVSRLFGARPSLRRLVDATYGERTEPADGS